MKIIGSTKKEKRGWYESIAAWYRRQIFSLMIFPVIFWLSAPGMAEAADYREELQWSQMETDLLEGNSVEWHLDDAAKATTTTMDERTLQEAVVGNQAPEVPVPREAPQPLEAAGSTNAPSLVEHPVNFVSTVLWDARA